MTRSIPLDVAIAEAEKSGFLSIEDLQRLASPHPANLAQVTDAIRGIVEDALNSAIPEPWEVAEHATQRILAAIGAGGQAVDVEAIARVVDPAAWADDLPVPTRADTIQFHERRQASCETARRILSALSQPHPADERVVEALREAKAELIRLVAAGVPIHSLGQVETALTALATAAPTATGGR